MHGADTEEQVQREMNLFFPMETTVAVIKPDVYEKESERGLCKILISEFVDTFFQIIFDQIASSFIIIPVSYTHLTLPTIYSV